MSGPGSAARRTGTKAMQCRRTRNGAPVPSPEEPEEARTMSEFIYLYRTSDADRRAAMSAESRQQSMQAWLEWMRGLEAKGHIKNPGNPLGTEGRVVRGKAKTVTDGPFVEIKDLVLGYTVIEARDIDQAVELANGCPMLSGEGSVEVRPVAPM
jgi:hypothetical protein